MANVQRVDRHCSFNHAPIGFDVSSINQTETFYKYSVDNEALKTGVTAGIERQQNKSCVRGSVFIITQTATKFASIN